MRVTFLSTVKEKCMGKAFFLEKCFSGAPQADFGETLVYCSE